MGTEQMAQTAVLLHHRVRKALEVCFASFALLERTVSRQMTVIARLAPIHLCSESCVCPVDGFGNFESMGVILFTVLMWPLQCVLHPYQRQHNELSV